MDRCHYIKHYIKYKLCARHFRGDGVHSPFVFRLINNVFREKNLYYIYNNVEKIRNSLLNDNKEIVIKDLGTGDNTKRKISDIARKSLKNEKYAQLLFRLVNQAKPDTILELGTSFGITTLYLASYNSKARCITIEGCPETLKIASNIFNTEKCNNIETHEGNINQLLPTILNDLEKIDFVFFDANHQEQATLDYFNLCLNKKGEKSVFVFDDIYWSKGMTKAWQKIKTHPSVRVSIDVFQMGIIYFDEELQKGDYILRF
jgi:predicted O-methyltransferase YrrM